MTDRAQQIIIEGGLVKIVETNVVKQASLDDFLPLLTTRQPIHIPGLPANISHLGANPLPNGNTEVDILIENVPTLHHISFQKGIINRNGRHEEKNYRLAFPWVYFAFHMVTTDPALKGDWSCQNWTIWWSKNRVMSLNDRVNVVSLPNCYADGRICFGNLGRAGNTSLADFVNGTVNMFWTSTFNEDLTIRYPGGYKDFDEWQSASAANPEVWTTWPELQSGTKNLKDVFRNAADRFAPVTVPGTIPQVPLPMTFNSIEQWFSLMSDTEKARMRDYVSGAGQYIMRPRMP